MAEYAKAKKSSGLNIFSIYDYYTKSGQIRNRKKIFSSGRLFICIAKESKVLTAKRSKFCFTCFIINFKIENKYLRVEN